MENKRFPTYPSRWRGNKYSFRRFKDTALIGILILLSSGDSGWSDAAYVVRVCAVRSCPKLSAQPARPTHWHHQSSDHDGTCLTHPGDTRCTGREMIPTFRGPSLPAFTSQGMHRSSPRDPCVRVICVKGGDDSFGCCIDYF
jgi:hypothetical protein